MGIGRVLGGSYLQVAENVVSTGKDRETSASVHVLIVLDLVGRIRHRFSLDPPPPPLSLVLSALNLPFDTYGCSTRLPSFGTSGGLRQRVSPMVSENQRRHGWFEGSSSVLHTCKEKYCFRATKSNYVLLSLGCAVTFGQIDITMPFSLLFAKSKSEPRPQYTL